MVAVVKTFNYSGTLNTTTIPPGTTSIDVYLCVLLYSDRVGAMGVKKSVARTASPAGFSSHDHVSC